MGSDERGRRTAAEQIDRESGRPGDGHWACSHPDAHGGHRRIHLHRDRADVLTCERTQYAAGVESSDAGVCMRVRGKRDRPKDEHEADEQSDGEVLSSHGD